MRLPSHETGFDLAYSLHPARYRDNAGVSDHQTLRTAESVPTIPPGKRRISPTVV
jgi:hypothetical protein